MFGKLTVLGFIGLVSLVAWFHLSRSARADVGLSGRYIKVDVLFRLLCILKRRCASSGALGCCRQVVGTKLFGEGNVS